MYDTSEKWFHSLRMMLHNIKFFVHFLHLKTKMFKHVIFKLACFVTPIQEPYQWDSVAAISRKFLGIRYSILPYYYTLFYKAHRPVDSTNQPSGTVTRPLFFEFQKDINTYSIDRQFLIGSAIMISPVLTQGM